MRFRLVLAVVVAGLVIVGVLMLRMAGQIKNQRAQSAAQGIVGGGTVTFGNGQNIPVVQLPPPSAAATPPADPAFQKWLGEEGKEINNTSLDSSAKKAELSKAVANLTPGNAHLLLETAKNGSSPAGQRILAAYLLVEAGSKARGELQQLITAPPVNAGPHEAHSEGELKGVQERSLRMMAVEGLLHQAESDSAARDVLAQTIPNIPDPYIKDYAQKRLASLKAH